MSGEIFALRNKPLELEGKVDRRLHGLSGRLGWRDRGKTETDSKQTETETDRDRQTETETDRDRHKKRRIQTPSALVLVVMRTFGGVPSKYDASSSVASSCATWMDSAPFHCTSIREETSPVSNAITIKIIPMPGAETAM
jgi:hypothetical protein